MSENTAPTDEFDRAEIHRLLSNPTRLWLVRSLRGTESTTRQSLASKLADAEPRIPERIETDGGISQLEAELHHTHLPKLAAYGIIEYDPATSTVDVLESHEAVYAVMDAVSE